MRLNRRELLTGNTQTDAHIASMVIQCLPQKLEDTAASLAAIENVDVPEKDERGKLVVLIEAADQGILMDCIKQIETTSGVISANLVYHQIDNETE